MVWTLHIYQIESALERVFRRVGAGAIPIFDHSNHMELARTIHVFVNKADLIKCPLNELRQGSDSAYMPGVEDIHRLIVFLVTSCTRLFVT